MTINPLLENSPMFVRFNRQSVFAYVSVTLFSTVLLGTTVAQESSPSILEELPAPAPTEELPTNGLRSVLEQDEIATPTVPNQVPPAPSPSPLVDASPSIPAEEAAVQPLQQGPIHEAFATAPTPTFTGDVAPYAPPEPIREDPAIAMPNSSGSTWIPGYWHWDTQQQQYIWISGLYRIAPPGRTWVPCVWAESDNGQYVRFGGYWADAGSPQGYLPTPPAPRLETPSLAPSNQSFWLPGHWAYEQNQYQWTPGYWTDRYSDWIWQPASYIRTPTGFVFVSGYWDYEPTVRGTPFAPVVISPIAYGLPGFRYQPNIPIAAPGNLMVHLFVRSGFRNYYYGDYYSAATLGYSPWYRGLRGSPWSSPLLDYYSWKYNAMGIPLSSNLNQYYDYMVSHPAARSVARVGINVTGKPFSSVSVSPLGTTLDAIVRNPLAGLAPARYSASSGMVGPMSQTRTYQSLSPNSPALRTERSIPGLTPSTAIRVPDTSKSVYSPPQQSRVNASERSRVLNPGEVRLPYTRSTSGVAPTLNRFPQSGASARGSATIVTSPLSSAILQSRRSASGLGTPSISVGSNPLSARTSGIVPRLPFTPPGFASPAIAPPFMTPPSLVAPLSSRPATAAPSGQRRGILRSRR